MYLQMSVRLCLLLKSEKCIFKDHPFSDNLATSAFNCPTTFMLSSDGKKKKRKKNSVAGLEQRE